MPAFRLPVRLVTRLLIHGRSMEPTFSDGQRVWASPLPYWFSAPARGDVVAVWVPPEATQLVLKRIVGLPGEGVSWTGNAITIDGALLDEPYAHVPPSVPGDEPAECRLARDHYFIAGDHRLASRDSRHYGPVARRMIYGKVLGVPRSDPARSCAGRARPACPNTSRSA